MSTGSSSLAGHILIDLSASSLQVRNERPELVRALAVGRPAAALPGLLAALFALCAHAHRSTAQHAVLAALASLEGRDPDRLASGHPLQAEQMRWDTAREHLRRMWLDWPRAWPEAQADAALGATLLRESPLWRVPSGSAAEAVPGAAHDDTAWQAQAQAWLQVHVYGEAPVSWLHRMLALGEPAMRQWAMHTDTWPARFLRQALAVLGHRRLPLQALHVGDPLQRAAIVAQVGTWDEDAAALRAPLGAGSQPETGPWCRAHASDGAVAEPTLWWRLAARLIDLARLSLPTGTAVAGPTGAAVLRRGAWLLGEGDALAWTEMARGVLLHRVRLVPSASGPVVAACHVVSPTEWHAHPAGPLATALRAVAADATVADVAPLVPWLAAVYDPCVPTVVQVHRPQQEEVTCMN
jgi:hypothetical protein